MNCLVCNGLLDDLTCCLCGSDQRDVVKNYSFKIGEHLVTYRLINKNYDYKLRLVVERFTDTGIGIYNVKNVLLVDDFDKLVLTPSNFNTRFKTMLVFS